MSIFSIMNPGLFRFSDLNPSSVVDAIAASITLFNASIGFILTTFSGAYGEN